MKHDISIVVPVFNQRAYTEQCLKSLATDMANGVQIVVLDNGSSQETRDFLAAVPKIELIRNETNRGCAPAWNQGVAKAGGHRVVILNNDVVVPPGWLEGLVEYSSMNRVDIASPAIREGILNYDFENYAADFMRRMATVERRGIANGICFMIDRRVLDKIGNFDETFRIGQFEDTDFFWRARQAGFRLGTTGASFLHHHGSATQIALRSSAPKDEYEAENRRRFRQKWRLSGWRRFWTRAGRQTRGLTWRWRERLVYGHTLYEKWIGGRLRYY